MALTRRGKFVVVGVVVIVVAGVLVVMAAFGKGPEAIRDPLADVGIGDEPAPVAVTCPLTGAPAPGGKVPERPALAVKVENAEAARPQYGLNEADIVYEEPVEGGITRFIAIYQCADAKRIEPIRSARTSDPAILVQYGNPVFAFADAAGYVVKAVEKEEAIIDVHWEKTRGTYHEDPGRDAPHHIYSSTEELWKASAKEARKAKLDFVPPEPVFTYGAEMPEVKSGRAKQVELEFSSSYPEVVWRWKGGAWQRSHGSELHRTADGGQVEADNVLIQVVKLKNTGRKDSAGTPVPEVQAIGSGKAYLLRDGRAVLGTWERKSESDVTVFATKSGEEFVLKPGRTWVELYPKQAPKIHL